MNAGSWFDRITAFCFGIHFWTPEKAVWLGLVMTSLVLKAIAVWRLTSLQARMFFVAAIIASILQGSPHWGDAQEVALVIVGWGFVLEGLRGSLLRFSISIGALIAAALMYADPPPYGKYLPNPYFIRLYSTAFFFGTASGAALLQWADGGGLGTYMALKPVWMLAILGAGVQRHGDRWVIGATATSIQIACLVLWLKDSAVAPVRKAGILNHPFAVPPGPS